MATIVPGLRRFMVIGFFAALLLSIPLAVSLAAPGDTDTLKTASRLVRLSLKDGSTLVGTAIRETADSLVFRTGSGMLLTITQNQIAEKEDLSGAIVNGEYKRYDPNISRLFFGPTAHAVRGGYFSAYEIFFPFLAFGIADIFTLAGGMTLVPGATDQLYYVAPKITIPLETENFGIAGGLLYTNILGGEGGAGVAYGVTTIGSNSHALTLGMGLGFSGGEWAEKPVLLIGGEATLSNSVALITENWFPLGSDVQLISFGVRFFGERLSADLGFVYPLTDDTPSGFPFLPWLGFCYNFGY